VDHLPHSVKSPLRRLYHQYRGSPAQNVKSQGHIIISSARLLYHQSDCYITSQIEIIIIITMLMPKLNSLTHLRALLVLHDRGILLPTQLVSLGLIPPAEVN
jgi:hypothetical protein